MGLYVAGSGVLKAIYCILYHHSGETLTAFKPVAQVLRKGDISAEQKKRKLVRIKHINANLCLHITTSAFSGKHTRLILQRYALNLILLVLSFPGYFVKYRAVGSILPPMAFTGNAEFGEHVLGG